MRIIPLYQKSDTDYSCIVYWLLGDSNEAQDKNTLIDAGSANLSNLGYYMREMTGQSKGIGKMAIEQILLTHNHYDHSGGLKGLIRQFNPLIYSRESVGGNNSLTTDGMHIRVGNEDALILHTPGHSEDSLCVYIPEKEILFSGDTVFRISDDQGTYDRSYLATLERLSALKLKEIYPGHGHPITEDADGFIKSCLNHVLRSTMKN